MGNEQTLVRDLRREQAEKLREMAANRTAGMPEFARSIMADQAGALLAGAAALEAVDVAREALKPLAEAHAISQLPHDDYMKLPRKEQTKLPHLISIYTLCAKAAEALARLEAL